MTLREYINKIDSQYQTGKAREHSCRPALKDLLASMLPKMIVTNEPARIDCGVPDYIITHRQNGLPVFLWKPKILTTKTLTVADNTKNNIHTVQTGSRPHNLN